MTAGINLKPLTLGIAAFAIAGCDRQGSQDEATVFMPEIVSSKDHHEFLDYYSTSDEHLIFTRASLDYSRSMIFQSWVEEGDRKVSPLDISDSGYDADATISPDQHRVIFTSTRASFDDADENWNLWTASSEFVQGRFSFGATTLLQEPVNSSSSECCAVFVSDEEFLFASDRSGNWDIYRATKTDEGYRVLPVGGDVNSDHGEWPNQYFNDSGVLLFSSIRPDGVGGDDIYVSRMDEDGFIPPAILPAPVNSIAYEDNALVANGALYWSSRRQHGDAQPQQADIFTMGIDTREDLKRLLSRGE